MFHAKLRWASCAYGLSARPVPVVCLHVLCLWCAFTASYTSCTCGVPAQRPVPVVCLHVLCLYVLCLWCACTASYTSCACGLSARPVPAQRPVPVVCLHSDLCLWCACSDLCLWCACTSCACGVPAQRALTQSVWIGFKADTPRCTHTHFTGAVM